MRYRNALESLIASLRANPRLTVREATLTPPADPHTIAAVARTLRETSGLELPQNFLDFYAELDGFTLIWEPNADLKVFDPRFAVSNPGGLHWNYPPCYTQWLPIASLRAGREDEVRWDDTLEATAAVPFLIDHDQEQQGSWWVSLAGETRLYYVHNQGEDVDRLALDFEAYFAAFVARRGFFCWQEMLTGEAARSERWMAALFSETA